jgi:hypothetical protein
MGTAFPALKNPKQMTFYHAKEFALSAPRVATNGLTTT